MPLQTLLAGLPPGKVHADDLLGYMVMYSVPDRMVEYKDIVIQWSQQGLDPDLMPAPGRPTDVFALACAAVATKRIKGFTGEVILVERASTDGCTYQITRSVRDGENRIVEHPKAMSVTFDPASRRMDVLRREDYEALEPLERQIRANYRAFKSQIHGSKVRTAVRETVRNLGGTNYLGKPVYMVPRTGLSTLESVGKVLEDTYGEDAHISLIPMLNTKANQNDLSRFHADDMRERSEALIATVASKLKAGGVVRRDMLANILRQNKELRAQRDKIVEVLGRETQSVDDRLATVAEQIDALMALDGEAVAV